MAGVYGRNYSKVEEELTKHPAVQAMAAEIKGEFLESEEFFHDSGTPTFVFMGRANSEFVSRCKRPEYEDYTGPRHIGAVANAITMAYKEQHSDE